ncbi:THUMP domain-containing class I SAM-dependent RNA methyltransferase [Streptococcus sp. DD12]|uniref:THUMP domain-containing class I SAM-dependent RNA methyltransferase n=1 Tax=Streptococcus sp. DD12 TaxID=1777880 RepID=UPI0007964A73|nr:class I SAM-dependent RNA methyltransferase [Streptococcus sp. DD12]KXT75269.1 putative N6-adenine-specific DNA methylase [Streptococcus sp. DD12]
MTKNKETYQMIATAASGLEAVVGKELRALGFDTQVENGRVRFSGTVSDMLKANLWLRAADKVKLVVGEFKATTFEELFQGVFALDWERYIALGMTFPISKAKAVKSKLHNEPSIQAITKKAIVKKLQTYYHRPMTVPLPETGPLIPIEVSLVKDKVLLMINTSGDSLFKRGYRVEKGGAPMKENMAAALIALTNWYPDKPFVDPTCGSGTLCIEAALIGLNRAPGLSRRFICEDWPWVDSKTSQNLRQEAKKAERQVSLDISGFDIDARMVAVAQANVDAAGLADVITLKQMRLQDFRTEKTNGVIVSNPPYGERLLDDRAVDILYNEMGQTFAPLKTWSQFIVTSDVNFEKKFGRQADKKRKLYNGRLRVDFYQFFGQRVKRVTSDKETN